MSPQSAIEPLPYSVRQRLSDIKKDHSESSILASAHPGLFLDKYVRSWSYDQDSDGWSKQVQKQSIQEIVRLSQKPHPDLDFQSLLQRQRQTIQTLGAYREVKATTTGPFTLHLSRASALENAGICLHPIYGFVYLPGSGIKGMSRAWAETVWLENFSDSEKQKKKKLILAVFGNEPGEKDEDQHATGTIVFHDGWPESWPRLQEDILNSHHSKYYEGTDKNYPPGDWEDPIPVYFLSVVPNTQFAFSLTYRQGRDQDNNKLMDLAEQFLTGALLHNGAGAKTNAGYGAFRIDSSTQSDKVESAWNQVGKDNKRVSFECDLELVTPAFLSGPGQEDSTGCDLRSSTLRGVLRFWWRTMHASWLSVTELRRLEAALWGDTNTSGAIRLTVESENNPSAISFDRRQITKDYDLPTPPKSEIAQGLTYHSFGMNDKDKREGKVIQRCYRTTSCKWKIFITVRPAYLRTGRDNEVTKLNDVSNLLEQAQAALWLLVQFGGVGSKSRKGFGSLKCNKTMQVKNLDEVRLAAEQFRQSVGLKSIRRDADSASIDELLNTVSITTPWKNHWFAIDRIADAAQEFAQGLKFNRKKRALGLPREIGTKKSPRQPFGKFRPGRYVDKRHASPLLYHFRMDTSGNYIIDLLAFPSSQLPDLTTSRSFLRNAITDITNNINKCISKYAKQGQIPVPIHPNAQPDSLEPNSSIPQQLDFVKAELLSEKSKRRNKSWKAKHLPTGFVGPIINSVHVPSESEPGQEVELIVARCNSNKKEIDFNWPTPEEIARVEKAKKKQQNQNNKKRRKR